MNPALETLMSAFSTEEGLPVPARAFFLGAQPHPALREWPDITGWQPLKPLADSWDRAGFPRIDETPPNTWPLVLILPGKSRDETLAWFAMARRHLAPGGTILVAMPNTAGAARFEKEFSRATGTLGSIQKNKCRAFHSAEDGTWDEALFSEWTALDDFKNIPETGFVTRAGIFSCDHIDPGSQLLADHLPVHLHGTVADLGAGWGFLTKSALRKCPNITRIDLYEADARALDCARRNLAGWNSPDETTSVDIRYLWHDVTTGLSATYDAIIMNPPFHTGQATDTGLGRAFLTNAVPALKRGGRLLLVANRQLPYEGILDACNLSWRKTVEDKTYKILHAEKR